MTDWDATRYHRLSDPQLLWGRKILTRLGPVTGERILDLGCGTGRLTSEIAAESGNKVIGLDRSENMLAEARRTSDALVSAHRPVYVRLNIAARKGHA